MANEVQNDVTSMVHSGNKQTTYVFRNLSQGTYNIQVNTHSKPSECVVKVHMSLKIDLPTEAEQGSSLFTSPKSALSSLQHSFISQSEINELNRYVETLPMTLNTYKYLRDEDYILISQYIHLNPRSEFSNKNTISFRLLSQSETYSKKVN